MPKTILHQKTDFSSSSADGQTADAERQIPGAFDYDQLRFLQLLLLVRSKGVGVRQLAKTFGGSKSAMARLLRDIDALPQDVLSQLGQPHGGFPQISEDAPSQMGHDSAEGRP